ncbi:uncharacterized protein LOC131615853 [Vicia villosa]|uniref:uncharacterized protein LOC131615853 n=1 Tax=Vicia villosa TaxID=3911 RepID=UPI00273BD146|nr:uncharacterized protein LOC131615853 [Vicia villosa]
MTNQVVEKGSDPRSLITSLHWRNFIDSQWKDANYKRTAIASFIQAVYCLEQDRQEKRTQENSLAPEYWIPFKYKPTQILIDERDGSIFGVMFEWDRLAALSEFKPFKPIGAPRAVLALRGTLIRPPTVRRDFEDDFRFVAWESLKDSVRFKVATDAVKSVSYTYGSRNVCIAGHSLGAGFVLQVGKELAKERINVETHAFNPPAVSLALSLGNIGEKAGYIWNRIKYMLPLGTEAQVNNNVDKTCIIRLKKMIRRLSCLMDTSFGTGKWVPHLYVNKNDWISYFYIHTHGTKEEIANVENMDPTIEQNEAKLFVVSRENQKFLEAHGLKQWWSNDSSGELKHGNHNNTLISMQLKSLNTGTPSQVVLFYYPRYVSLATRCINIREASDYVWSILKCVPCHISGKAQINNDGEVISGIGLVGWIPSLSGLKDTGYWVCKWIPRMYVGAEEKMVGKENMDPEDGQITPKLLIFSKEQLKFLAAHGLEQWWPNDVELHRTICDGKLVSRKVKSLFTGTPWDVITKGSNLSFISLATRVGEKEEFILKCNSLKFMLPSSNDAHKVCSDEGKISDVGLKGWIPQLSCLKDTAYWVWKCVPHLYVNKNGGGIEENVDCSNAKTTSKLCPVSKEQQKFLATHGLEQWWPNDAELRKIICGEKLVSKKIKPLYTNTPWEVTKGSNLSFLSLVMCIGEKEEFIMKFNSLKSMLPSSSEAHVCNNEGKTSGDGLRGWIPQLSCLKDSAYWVWKCVPHLYVNKNGDIEEKEVDKKENVDCANAIITSKLCVVSKEQRKFLTTHGLKQWWPSDAYFQQAIHDSNLISRKIRSLYTETPWENPSMSLPICFGNIAEKEEFAWKWNTIKSAILSNSETQASNDCDNKTPYVPFQSWMSPLSSFKDAGFAVVQKASPMLNLPFVSPVTSHGNNEEKDNFVSSSETQVSNDSDKTSCESLKSWIPSLSGFKDAAVGIGKLVPYLYANKSDVGIGEKMVDKENKGPLE